MMFQVIIPILKANDLDLPNDGLLVNFYFMIMKPLVWSKPQLC